ncbi:hypothetical protein QM012_009000 [Aureobasidium pullulans]|uniref:PH domain-containing protein n=1 Tax=Aureobasidium pullulans TaxID=5580 RepID=A0ABR0TJM0_AURPU
MNINQWIQSLELAVSPNELSLSTDQPHALLKRGRGSRTSSLLEPLANQNQRCMKHKKPVVYVDSSSSDTGDATSTSTSSCPTSRSSSSSSKRYRRRPRYHTKTDKYQSKSRSKPQEKRPEKRKKEKEKRAKHSRRNKHKNKAVTGVVRTFRAKNVPKDRLTLDSGTKFGLYTRGRSSGPTKGKGLPDLVFSEMRFLQKPESSTQEEPNTRPKKNLHKKKRHQLSEYEISRYFDAGAKRPSNDNTGQHRRTPPLDTTIAARDVQIASPVVPDLYKKPFLGFRNRGSHPPTTKYYSWSESGKESSARMAHFARGSEPLAVGQLQSGRAQQHMEAILLEQDTARRRSPEQISPGHHGKRQEPSVGPAQGISKIACSPIKPQRNKIAEAETLPVPIFDKNVTSVPVGTSPARQSERGRHGAHRTLPADEAMLNELNDDVCCHTNPEQPGLTVNPSVKQYSEPWEELLQNCKLAARPPTRNYHDEDFSRCGSPAIDYQRSSDIHTHLGAPSWLAEGDQFPEYGYPYKTACTNEHVHWAQPIATGCQDDNVSFLGENIDEVSESLDSQYDHELATEDAVEWGIDDAERYNEVQDCQVRDGEAMDDFATFWQPNKLY